MSESSESSESSAPSQSEASGGIPSWVLSAGAVAIAAGALWWGTREPTPEPAKQPTAQAVQPKAPAQPVAKPALAASESKGALARAIELERSGDLATALDLSRQASAGGAGRDAYLLEAKILILQKKYDEARAPLRKLLELVPGDADAHYNLGLTWQEGPKPNYNYARNNYLAALKSSPNYAAARYNLSVLCLKHGIMDEAKHHASRFVKDYPQDPRGANLQKLVAAAESAKAPAATGAAKQVAPESP
jgi:tetratricopeptide (TPR) repeat protein